MSSIMDGFGTTSAERWSHPNSDPMQDIIDAKAHLDKMAEEENWERDVWLPHDAWEFYTNTPEGRKAHKEAEFITGYKLNLRSVREITGSSWRDIVVQQQIFKQLPIIHGGKIHEI